MERQSRGLALAVEADLASDPPACSAARAYFVVEIVNFTS